MAGAGTATGGLSSFREYASHGAEYATKHPPGIPVPAAMLFMHQIRNTSKSESVYNEFKRSVSAISYVDIYALSHSSTSFVLSAFTLNEADK